MRAAAAVYGLSGLQERAHLQQFGRKSYPAICGRKKVLLFCGSVKGAESSAIVYSLVETAKANGIEPYEYPLLALSMLPYLGKSPAHNELEKLTPWYPAVRHRDHIRK